MKKYMVILAALAALSFETRAAQLGLWEAVLTPALFVGGSPGSLSITWNGGATLECDYTWPTATPGFYSILTLQNTPQSQVAYAYTSPQHVVFDAVTAGFDWTEALESSLGRVGYYPDGNWLPDAQAYWYTGSIFKVQDYIPGDIGGGGGGGGGGPTTPEPEQYALVAGLGLLAFGLIRRRNRGVAVAALAALCLTSAVYAADDDPVAPPPTVALTTTSDAPHFRVIFDIGPTTGTINNRSAQLLSARLEMFTYVRTMRNSVQMGDPVVQSLGVKEIKSWLMTQTNAAGNVLLNVAPGKALWAQRAWNNVTNLDLIGSVK